MPALVNISVGSLRGTSGDEGTAVCPFFSKKPRKEDRISFTLCMARLVTRNGRLRAAATTGKAFYRGGYGNVHREGVQGISCMLCPSDPKRDRSANRRRPSVMNLRVWGRNGDRET